VLTDHELAMVNTSATNLPVGSPGAGDFTFRRPLSHRLDRLAAEVSEVTDPDLGQRPMVKKKGALKKERP